MKIHKTIIVCIVVGIATATIFLTQHSTAQEQNEQVYDIACEVKDVSSLKDCVQQVKENKNNLIKITKMVECTSRDDCAIDFSDLKTSLKIYGISNAASGFRRTTQFDYSLFTFKNNKNITIGSFLIDDNTSGDCAALGTPCPPSIVFENVKDSSIDQLNTVGTKDTAVSVVGSTNITIKNSSFDGSQNHSVVVKNATKPSTNISLEHNIFSDSSSNAVVFAAGEGSNSIKNNTFTHNHKDPIYNGCVGICSASQLLIMPFTKNVSIENNTLNDGNIDVYTVFGMYASGVEISRQFVEDITLRCNKIYNNTGNGVVIPERTAATKNIILEQNAIYNNGINLNLNAQTGDTIQNNCFDASCKVSGC